jgi:HAD superfamily hydrolase (TIGR01450 family)
MIMTALPLSPALRPYAHVLLDLDGCVWVGDEACPGAVEAVATLRGEGRTVRYLTNDVRYGPEDFVRKLWRLGFQAAVDEVITVGSALQRVLEARGGGAAFVIGSQALVDHVADAGMRVVNRTPFATRADLVVVGAHEDFDYGELRTGAQAVARGAELIGATRDATFPMPDGAWPATGAILAAMEAAVGRSADLVVGKPEPGMYEAARATLGPGRVLAVGDRLDVDVAGARRAGLDSALVLTGVATRADAADADPRPTHVAESLHALVVG